MRKILLLLGLFSCWFSWDEINAQCPTSLFSVDNNACREQMLLLDNQSTNATSFDWYFCTSSFNQAPAYDKLLSTYGPVYYTKALTFNGDRYLFFVAQSTNRLVGLKFTDLDNLTYVLHCDIDISSVISGPTGIDISNDNGTWYAFITSIGSPFNLIRVELDNTLQNMVQSTSLSSGLALNTPFDIKILNSNNQFFVFLTNNAGTVTQQLTRLAFGSSLSNSPTVSYIALPTGSQAASLDFYNDCGIWTGFLSSRNGKIYRIDFGNNLGVASPVLTDLTLNSTLNDPAGLALIREHDIFVLLIQSRNGFTYYGNLGTTLTNNNVSITALGNFKSSTRDWDIEIFREENDYKIIVTNFSNGAAGGFYSLVFPKNCPANLEYSQNQDESIHFLQAGTHKVTLVAKNTQNDWNRSTRQIVVSTNQAPAIALTIPPVWCASSAIEFDFSSDIPVNSQVWNFGDGIGSSSDNPASYQFTTDGSYLVTLSVEGSNGCSNLARQSIDIFPPPLIDFEIPSGIICTNNDYTFINTSQNEEFVQNYEWEINEEPVGNTRDLIHSFLSTGTKEIALIAFAPGCQQVVEKTISNTLAGPLVDFAFSGTPCEQQQILFSNHTVGSVSNYVWDFDDGTTSSIEEPTHTFSPPGDYSITLQANSSNGCQNSKTENLTIYSKPQTNFSIALPPFSCSGSLSQFYDTTPLLDDSNLTFWLWDFGNGNTSLAQNPQFLFNDAGDYNVSLTVGSNFGCETTLQKTVTILQTPAVVITKTPACQHEPVEFSASANVPISNWEWKIEDTFYYTQNAIHLFPEVMTYPVSLKATGENSCVNSTILPITIHQPLTPNFSVLKNCNNQDTEFINSTVVTTDPVNFSEWNFGDGGVGQDSPAIHTFQNTGNVDVMLTVTTVEGCQYSRTKSVSIVDSPQASFGANPDVGLPPLAVQFNNTSTHATNYLWQFHDENNTTSTAESPTATFFDYGTHIVDLTAYNAFDCSSTYSGMIEVQFPLPDVAIADLTINETQDGFLIAALKITNQGNTTIHNLKLNISLSGIVIQKVLEQDIIPGVTVNYLVDFSVQRTNQLDYLCITAELPDDVNPDDNQLCTSYDENTFFFTPYPNPTQGVINIDWIAPDNQVVHITIYDRLGNQYSSAEVTSLTGINQLPVDLTGMAQGIYYVVVRSGHKRKTFPIMRN